MSSRRTRFLLPVAIAGLAGLLVAALPAIADAKAGEDHTRKPAASLRLQNDFDHIGAEVHELTHNGRTSYYIDEGKEGDRAVVFIGGASTSVEAFQLTEFARTMREELGLRVISVERNGLGASKVDPTLGYSDYNDEVLAVLDHLGIDRFTIIAISGGGAYAAQPTCRIG